LPDAAMQISDNAGKILKHYEQGPGGDFAPNPYLCPAGKRTVGWGHVILPFEKFNFPISRDEADSILQTDLAKALIAVMSGIKVALNQGQIDAITSFTFNVGDHAFLTSTMLKYINASKFQLAAAEFGKWVFAGGMVLPGLVRRRNCESHLFLTGELLLF
jgi:lysozyme